MTAPLLAGYLTPNVTKNLKILECSLFMFVCLFILRPFQKYLSYVDGLSPSHLSYKVPV